MKVISNEKQVVDLRKGWTFTKAGTIRKDSGKASGVGCLKVRKNGWEARQKMQPLPARLWSLACH